MPIIKARQTPLAGCGDDPPNLIILHPHYTNFNKLIKLPALDEGHTVDYDVALIICGIIADNSWNVGWFARSSDGTKKCDPNKPLAPVDGEVFYFVKESTYKYPICMSWDQWRLPLLNNLPAAFSSLSIEPPSPSLRGRGSIDDVKSRDKSCRVSGIIDCCDQAHLVPAVEREWWDLNVPYESNMDIEAAENGILLRADLHRSFDAGAWVPMAVNEGRLVLYMVRSSVVSNQFAMIWHNTEMQALKGVNKLCLFARVAWTVLSLHHQFLGTRRLAAESLLVRMKSGALREMRPDVFIPFAQSRSKPYSPTKRPRLRGLDDEEASGRYGDETNGETAEIDFKEPDAYEDEDDTALYHRGRKRLRTSLPTPSRSSSDREGQLGLVGI